METSGEVGNKNTEGQELVKEQLRKVVLGDGQEYEIVPLNLNILIELEDEYKEDMQKVIEMLAHPTTKVIRHVLFLKMKAKYPQITEEQVGELVTPEVMPLMGNLIG